MVSTDSRWQLACAQFGESVRDLSSIAHKNKPISSSVHAASIIFSLLYLACFAVVLSHTKQAMLQISCLDQSYSGTAKNQQHQL